jgi:hypothetical protein
MGGFSASVQSDPRGEDQPAAGFAHRLGRKGRCELSANPTCIVPRSVSHSLPLTIIHWLQLLLLLSIRPLYSRCKPSTSWAKRRTLTLRNHSLGLIFCDSVDLNGLNRATGRGYWGNGRGTYLTDTLDTTPARTPASTHTACYVRVRRTHAAFVASPRFATILTSVPPSPLDARACCPLQ